MISEDSSEAKKLLTKISDYICLSLRCHSESYREKTD